MSAKSPIVGDQHVSNVLSSVPHTARNEHPLPMCGCELDLDSLVPLAAQAGLQSSTLAAQTGMQSSTLAATPMAQGVLVPTRNKRGPKRKQTDRFARGTPCCKTPCCKPANVNIVQFTYLGCLCVPPGIVDMVVLSSSSEGDD